MTRWLRWLALATPALVAVWAYGYSVGLPFFTDDAPHYRFLVGVESIPALWLGQAWSPYYRPVVYSLWKAGLDLQGGYYDPVVWHTFNVLLYAFSGVLVALLAKRVWRAPVWGAVAGVLFVLFPMNYQAVNWVGSLSHLVVLFGVVLAVLAGIIASQRGGMVAYALCWLGALLAIFTHENGLLVAPFLIMTLWWVGVRRWRAYTQVALVPCVLAGVYVVLWLALPRPRLDEGLRFSLDIVQNMATLLHGLIYPVSVLLRPFVVGKPDNALVLGVVVLTVVIVAGVAWRARALGVFLWAVAWFVGSVSLSVFLLQPDYVYSSPRLLVLASVGVVVFWGVLWRALARRGGVWRGVAVAGVLVMLGMSVVFLQAREKDYLRMAAYAQELFAVVERVNVRDEGLLIINAPNYIAPTQASKFFLTGEEFASFMTPEISYNDYLWVNTGVFLQDSPIRAVAYGELLQYPDGMFVPYYPMLELTPLQEVLQNARHIVVTQFVGDDFFPVYVAGAGQTGAEVALASFGGGDMLLTEASYSLVDAQRLRVRQRWQVNAPQEAKRFVHVLCDGRMVGQSDGYVWMNLYPFSFWQPQESQTDQLEIWTSEPVDIACLEVWAGVYSTQTGERLPAQTPKNGEELPNGAFLVSPTHALP